MVNQINLVKIEQIVKPQYDKLRKWAHAWPHIRRVARNARELAILVEADPIACQITAYCHDLGRVAEEADKDADRKKSELGNTDHSLDSIEMTIDVLRTMGVSGYQFNSIVGAVAVHADRLYHGRNLVAKVLRDSDKKDSLGPWGLLRNVNHHFGDFVLTARILENQDNPAEIRSLADETLRMIKEGNVNIREHYLGVLNFVLDWVENKMLDTEQAYDFMKSEYEYHKKAREFLLK